MSNPVRIGVGGRFTVVRLALPAALTLLCMLAIASPASALEQTVIVSGNDLLGSQMIYDLRRLQRKGLIRRVPKTQCYELTQFGRMIAVFFTKTYVRILNPSLAELAFYDVLRSARIRIGGDGLSGFRRRKVCWRGRVGG